jgi:hypothetical protein
VIFTVGRGLLVALCAASLFYLTLSRFARLNPWAKSLKVKFWWNYTTLLERILNETDTCASAARALLARGTPKNFIRFFSRDGARRLLTFMVWYATLD